MYIFHTTLRSVEDRNQLFQEVSTEVAGSSEMLRLSTKIHGVISQETVILRIIVVLT